MSECTCNAHITSRPLLRLNQIQQRDPTRTLVLRRQFVADMTRRFKRLMRLINESVVTNDAFGLTDASPLSTLQAAGRNDFAFNTTSTKVEAFMRWLQEQEDNEILEIIRVPGDLTRGIQRPWTDVYIQTAYQKGIARARSEMRAAGYDIPSFEDTGGSLEATMNGPVHADRAGVAFTRTFTELQGITRAMDQQISRVLAQGLLDGKNPREIARLINDRVSKIGLTRAKTLARTEVVRAHHKAMMQEYRAAGVAGVSIKAEWHTAGDSRVCARCAALEGQIFTLDRIEDLIPLHPNCRCIALPINVDDPEQVADAASRRVLPDAPDEVPAVSGFAPLPDPTELSATHNELWQEADSWYSTMSTAEKTAVRTYLRTDFAKMQGQLRGVGEVDGTMLKRAKVLENMIANNTLGRPQRVFRGTNTLPTDLQEARELVGQKITDKGFMSTSIKPSTTNAFGQAKIEIIVPPDQPAIYSEGFWRSQKAQRNARQGRIGEGEVTLPPNTTLEITGVAEEEWTNGTTKTVYKAEIVPVIDIE